MINTTLPRRRFSLSQGFTLVELLVVIAIIGVLATLVLVQLGTARGKSRDAKRISDISQLRTAVELYYDDEGGTYPTDIYGADLTKMLRYISTTALPEDPITGNPYTYGANPAAAPVTQYQLATELEQYNSSAFNADADINAVGWGRPGVNGATETNPCTSAASDCVYDQGQR